MSKSCINCSNCERVYKCEKEYNDYVKASIILNDMLSDGKDACLSRYNGKSYIGVPNGYRCSVDGAKLDSVESKWCFKYKDREVSVYGSSSSSYFNQGKS